VGSGGLMVVVRVCSEAEEDEEGVGVDRDLCERWADTSDFWRAAAEA